MSGDRDEGRDEGVSAGEPMADAAGRPPDDAVLGGLLRNAADRHLFAGLAWRDELRDGVLASLGSLGGEAASDAASLPSAGDEIPVSVPRRRPWAGPWLGWGGLAVAGAAAVLILVLAGSLRTGLRPGSPGPATLSRADGGEAEGMTDRSSRPLGEVPAPAAQPAAESGGAEAATSGLERQPAVAGKKPPGPILTATARLETGGVAVALRVENAPWDAPPPLEVAVIFPGVGERMGAVEGCGRDGDAWSCRALVKDVPDRARATSDLRVIVLLMQLPAGQGGAPAILAQARDVSVSR